MERFVAFILATVVSFSGLASAQTPKGDNSSSSNATQSVIAKVAILDLCARNGELATEVVAFRQVLDALGIPYSDTQVLAKDARYSFDHLD